MQATLKLLSAYAISVIAAFIFAMSSAQDTLAQTPMPPAAGASVPANSKTRAGVGASSSTSTSTTTTTTPDGKQTVTVVTNPDGSTTTTTTTVSTTGAGQSSGSVKSATSSSFGWTSWLWGGERVSGSGKLATEQRTVSGFDGISVSSGVKVVLRQSGKEAVEVKADDNIVPLIETRVEDRKLAIGIKRGYNVSTRNPVVVTVDLDKLNSISVAGTGDVESEQLKGSDLRVSIAGSGDVKLGTLSLGSLSVSIAGSGDFSASGSAPTQKYSISGSGDIRAIKLEGKDVTVKIAGSGDARVWAKDTLTASIAGSGDITYVGDAKISKSVAGSGSVSKY
jgi:hypothetical protein